MVAARNRWGRMTYVRDLLKDRIPRRPVALNDHGRFELYRIHIFLFCFALLSVVPAPVLRAQGMPPTVVETATTKELEFHEQLTLVGRTEASRESSIVAEISGRVASVNAPEGRHIRRGQALVTIDCRRIALDLDAKRAEVEQAAADAQLAEKDLARARALVATDVFPERNLDSATATAARSAARHRELEAESQRLQLDLDSCRIPAPFSGYTVRKRIDVGEWVAAGTPVYDLVDLETVKVTVDLPERHFGQVELGAAVAIRVPSADGDDIEVFGTVSGLAPRASETTHTFPVLIAVDNREGHLGSGMLVRAVVDLQAKMISLAVPKDALVRQGETTIVYTVDGDQATPVPVHVRASQGAHVAVEPVVDPSHLAAGQQVVVRGNERLMPGSRVQIRGTKETTP